jgi:hypothetical protein
MANDDDDIIPDGGSVRVPMEFMDSTQRAVATGDGQRTTVVDGLGRPVGPSHSPGFRYASDDAAVRQRAEAAYAARSQRYEAAWKNNPNAQPAEPAAPFKLASSVAELEELQRKSEAARQRSIERMENAWKRER